MIPALSRGIKCQPGLSLHQPLAAPTADFALCSALLASLSLLGMFLDKYVGMIFLPNAFLIYSCCFPWQAMLLLYPMLYTRVSEKRSHVSRDTGVGERAGYLSLRDPRVSLLATGTVLWVCLCVVPVWEPRASVIVMPSPPRV